MAKKRQVARLKQGETIPVSTELVLTERQVKPTLVKSLTKVVQERRQSSSGNNSGTGTRPKSDLSANCTKVELGAAREKAAAQAAADKQSAGIHRHRLASERETAALSACSAAVDVHIDVHSDKEAYPAGVLRRVARRDILRVEVSLWKTLTHLRRLRRG